ncbi:MAG: hypothetical protein IH905_12370, partial [Proteobacteria bacterium]|nr:hypothetical protein [Pseudomonadota bacterium]
MRAAFWLSILALVVAACAAGPNASSRLGGRVYCYNPDGGNFYIFFWGNRKPLVCVAGDQEITKAQYYSCDVPGVVRRPGAAIKTARDVFPSYPSRTAEAGATAQGSAVANEMAEYRSKVFDRLRESLGERPGIRFWDDTGDTVVIVMQ